jgi:hypothetical protein
MRPFHRTVLPVLMAAGAAIGGAGCRVARVRLPEPLVGVPPLKVSGRHGFRIHQHLTFGAFSTSRVSRSFTRAQVTEYRVVTDQRLTQHYGFTVSEGDTAAFAVTCLARSLERGCGRRGDR